MRIGWIGLGRMGRRMVENLVRKGFDVAVQNRSKDKVRELVAMGAKAGGPIPEMGARLDVIHTCLPGADIVRRFITGRSGALKRPKEGLIIVDHSTIHPDAARELAEAAIERGARFIDAPVSGSGPVAERGELTIMCGGDPEAFAAVRPHLEAMGKTVELMGPSGSGAATKVVNNAMMAANLVVAMEALILASKIGLDLERLYEVVRTASGASRAWERNVPRILKREFGSDGAAKLLLSDANIAADMATERLKTQPTMLRDANLFWNDVVHDKRFGLLGEEDPSHAITAMEKKLGVSLEEPR